MTKPCSIETPVAAHLVAGGSALGRTFVAGMASQTALPFPGPCLVFALLFRTKRTLAIDVDAFGTYDD